jgi:hypothetical protein
VKTRRSNFLELIANSMFWRTESESRALGVSGTTINSDSSNARPVFLCPIVAWSDVVLGQPDVESGAAEVLSQVIRQQTVLARVA